MSRSGYSDDSDDQWRHIMWRGAVASAVKGKRGQAFLREMLVALDAMPAKRLIADELEDKEGAVCAIGAVGKMRGTNMSGVDPEADERIASLFGIAPAMVKEIAFENDEATNWFRTPETPEQRWLRMHNWIEGHILADQQETEATA